MWWSQLLVLCLSVVLANALNTGHHYDLVLQKQNINENNDVVDVHATTSKIWSSKVVKTCKIRGGKTTVRSDIVSKLNLQLVSFLKTIIPKGWWPRSWKTKNNNSRTMSKEHLEKSFTKGDSNCRIQKELRSFMANPPDNCVLTIGSNIRSWVISIVGASDTIYAGEQLKLKIVFPKDYPSKPPSVYFLKPTPKHVHVYSNGDICLNLLGRDWRPTMTAQTLVISILSMLASAKEKKMPQDNAMHADAAPGQQQDNWMYHDEKC